MKQHKIIIETENQGLANLVVSLFENGTLTSAILDSPEYQRGIEEGTISEMQEESEVYFDELNRNYKTHKVQLSTL